MALKSTIYKVDLQVNNFDAEHYQQYSLNVALHPSEKEERMLVRLVAFALFANERLQFTKGLSTDEEPDLWQKSLSDEIEIWVELGFPDEKRLRKACSRAKKVIVFVYEGQKIDVWKASLKGAKLDTDKLDFYSLNPALLEPLLVKLDRNCALDCMIQDAQVTLSIDDHSALLPVSNFEL